MTFLRMLSVSEKLSYLSEWLFAIILMVFVFLGDVLTRTTCYDLWVLMDIVVGGQGSGGILVALVRTSVLQVSGGVTSSGRQRRWSFSEGYMHKITKAIFIGKGFKIVVWCRSTIAVDVV